MANTSRVAEMSTRQLRTIVAVARYENFLAAAAHLRTSQSAVSRVVKQVEEYLEVTLFDRTTRRVALTPAGREFIPLAERVLDDLQIGIDNLRQLNDAHRGRLYISSLASLSYDVLPATIKRYREVAPNVEIHLLQRLQSQILDDVRSGAADFGIANVAESDNRIQSIAIGEDRLGVILPKSHRLAKHKAINFRDLASEQLVSVSQAANARKLLDGVALSKGLHLDHSIVLDQVALVGQFVERGLGIAVVSSNMMSAERDTETVFAPLKNPQIKTKIAAYYLKDRGLTSGARQFIDALKAEYNRQA